MFTLECAVRPSTKIYVFTDHSKEEEVIWHKFLYRCHNIKRLAIDTETDGLFWYKNNLLMAQFYTRDFCVVIPFAWGSKYLPEDLSIMIYDLLNSPIKKYFWNAKFDLHFLKRCGGVEFNSREWCDSLDDGAVLSAMTSHETYPKCGLKERARKDLKYDMTEFREKFGKRNKKGKLIGHPNILNFELKDVAEYAAKDPISTYHEIEDVLLKKMNVPGMEKVKMLYEKVERPLVSVILEMEENGVPIDKGEVERQYVKGLEHLTELKKKAFKLCGSPVNMQSNKQVTAALVTLFNFPESKLIVTKKGNAKSDEGTINEYIETAVAKKLNKCVEFLLAIKDYKSTLKQFTTYITNIRATDSFIPDDTGKKNRKGELVGKWHRTYYHNGYIYPSFSQIGCRTGRFSTNSPTIQNWPRIPDSNEEKEESIFLIRKCVRAPVGYTLIDFDYSQIELRVLAHMSREPRLIKAFKDGLDIHKFHATLMFNKKYEDITKQERFFSKQTLSFGVLFGMQAPSLGRLLGVPTHRAQKLIDAYYQRNPCVEKLQTNCRRFGKKYGYSTSLLGRRRYVQEVFASNEYTQEASCRKLFSNRIQGGAADLVKYAMVWTWKDRRLFDMGVKLSMQIHDELLFIVPVGKSKRAIAIIKERMENFPVNKNLRAPLIVDGGCAWAWSEAH